MLHWFKSNVAVACWSVGCDESCDLLLAPSRQGTSWSFLDESFEAASVEAGDEVCLPVDGEPACILIVADSINMFFGEEGQQAFIRCVGGSCAPV